MNLTATKGACLLCGKECTKGGMNRHLEACLTASHLKNEAASRQCFHLRATADFTSSYWLNLLIDAEATFKALDRFLRDIWLECCGHLSMFSFDNQEVPMNRKLKTILVPGMKIEHEYDMGSTTSLLVSVVSARMGVLPKNKRVKLLARNQPPEAVCNTCGQHPAEFICSECYYSETGWLCKACAATHPCGDGDYFLLPVVNSPRTGVCGYTGD